MKLLERLAFVVVFAAAAMPALADIVVFNDGRVEEIPIINVTEQTVTVKSPYGEMEYPRKAIHWLSKSVPEKPGEEYYAAGLVMLHARRKAKAEELFQKAIDANGQYRPLVTRALADYDLSSRPSAPGEENRVRVVLTCPLCKGAGKIMLKAVGAESGSDHGAGLQSEGGAATVVADCPACSGRGYRILEVGPKEGLCPACLGAGGVLGDAKQTEARGFGDEHSGRGNSDGGMRGHAPYAPCRTCGGTGVVPLTRGGKREAIDQALHPNLGASTSPSGGSNVDEDKGEGEGEDEDSEETAPDNRSFLQKYRLYLIGGGGVLIVIALVASQMSKKKQ